MDFIGLEDVFGDIAFAVIDNLTDVFITIIKLFVKGYSNLFFTALRYLWDLVERLFKFIVR